jgi:hypothetical protein
MNNQKDVVWTEIALFAQDQLRQRMAWALAVSFMKLWVSFFCAVSLHHLTFSLRDFISFLHIS